MVNLLKPALVAAIALTGLSAATAHADKPPNFIVGTPRNDWLPGTRHPDIILARAGNDRLFGRRGNDILVGGDGDDHLFAWGPIGHSGTRPVTRWARVRPLRRRPIRPVHQLRGDPHPWLNPASNR